MSYTRDITDILRTLIAGMGFPVMIGGVTANADGYTLRCDNIYHAQVGFDIVINGETFRITSFDQSTETITVTGTGSISPGDTFQMYGVHFFHGVPVATTEELKDLDNSAVDNGQQKSPMIWLWENFTENVIDDFSPLGRDINMELYFLTQSDHEAWKTQQFYDNAIKPMRRLLDTFRDAVKADRATFDADELSYSAENYSKFGVYIRNRGSSDNLFVDKLSGVGIKLRLKLWAVEDCPADFEIDGTGIGTMTVGSTFTII